MGVGGTQSNKVYHALRCTAWQVQAHLQLPTFFWDSNIFSVIFLPALEIRYCYFIHFSILSLGDKITSCFEDPTPVTDPHALIMASKHLDHRPAFHRF